DLDLFAGRRQRYFLGLGAFQAGVFVGVETLDLGFREFDFVFDGVGLGRGSHGVALGAEADRLLLVAGGFALQAGAEGFFAVEGVGGGRYIAAGSGQSGIGVRDFAGQRTQNLGKASALEIERLELDKIF